MSQADRVQRSAAPERVVSMRGWLSARRRFDDLRRLRPWKVDLHDAAVGERRDRPNQLTIERAWPDADGVYFGLAGVDPWDEQRDARTYCGPYPVVAHPPCNKWSPLAYINRRRLPDYEIGDDGGCFQHALHAVLAFGDVIEHPASSLAWKHYGLPRPRRDGWQLAAYAGSVVWVTEVDQGSYGHRARKRTWLLYVGPEPAPLDWTPAESRVVVSGFLHHTGTDETRRVRPKEASRTPVTFRDVLVELARSCVSAEVAA